MGMEDVVIDQQSPMDITSPGSILSSEMMQEIMCDENLGTEEMKEGVWSLSSTDDSISPESKCSLFNQAVNSSEDPMLGLHTQSPAGALQVSPENGDNPNQILFPMLNQYEHFRFSAVWAVPTFKQSRSLEMLPVSFSHHSTFPFPTTFGRFDLGAST
jgi:hypothetical protein